jgi:hypothetical protein
VQDMREIVFHGPGKAGGSAPCIPAHATTRGDELFAGTHGGALRREWRQLVSMRAPPCALQWGVGGLVFRPAGGEGCAIPCQGQRIDREAAQQVILAQGEDERPVVECKAARHGVAVKARPQCSAPRVESRGRMLKLPARTCCGASSLEAHSLFGICPVDPHTGRTGVV